MTVLENRRSQVRAVLWTIVGAMAVVTVARFARGLGATTNLSDAAPWGFWIAFDVMAGVALAAGGFTLAATVYIFRLERYRPFARPAILTALLGYLAVAVGLTYDLGLPWHIWHPVVYPQPHSVLFEVAACVMLYLTVLILEFSPVVLEHRWFDRPLFRAAHGALKRLTIPLVITGIVLSTLHQSSLGSLFLIAPHRLHPLWYSPLIWVLFLISAIGLGLMMVTLESYVSAWLFGHRLRMDLLPGLAKVASAVLFTYAGLRLGDLAWRGQIGGAFDGSPLAWLFWFEMALVALIPATLLALPRMRASARGIGTAAVLAVAGIVGYRFNVCIVAFARPSGATYFPTWMEIAVSLGIVAAAALVFLFFVEKLKVYPHEEEPALPPIGSRFDPHTSRVLLPNAIAAPRRNSLGLVLGAALALALLPREALWGAQPEPAPVAGARAVVGVTEARDGAEGHALRLLSDPRIVPTSAVHMPLVAIDGNRDGRLVLFAHDRHAERLGGEGACGSCHHQNLPFERNSRCSSCHQDMFSMTDVFDHASHVKALRGNRGCVRCHQEDDEVKNRRTATACIDCHKDMRTANTLIQPKQAEMTGHAVGYMEAMHVLCVNCHQRKAEEDPLTVGADLDTCARCHRGLDDGGVERMGPYASRREPVPHGEARLAVH